MKPRIYLSAPITGHEPEERRTLFRQWQQMFADLGYQAVNPMDNGLPFDAPWCDHMKADLKLLLDCTVIVPITNEDSPGVRLEKTVAKAVGIKRVGADLVIISKGNPDALEFPLTT